MDKILKTVLFVVSLGLMHSVYAADAKTIAKEIKANQYTKCASSSLTTGLIKTAFNQRSDYESQTLITGGIGLALYAGWLSSPQYALNSYKEHQQKIKQDSLKYINNGSRDEIYKFTVSYLVPKNEKCFALFKEVGDALEKKNDDWDNFKDSKEAQELVEGIMQSAKEMVVGKNSK